MQLLCVATVVVMKEHQAKSQQAPTVRDSLDLQTNSNNV